MEKFIQQCVAEFTKLGYTKKTEIHEYLHKLLTKEYKGRAPQAKIDAVCDDIVESVCLQMNIDDK